MSNAKTFKHSILVPYAHTDQMRFVYYANYLIYFEMARAAMLREVGLPYGELEKQGLFLPVAEAHCEYKAPAHYDDELEIVSRCEIQGVRFKVFYIMSRAGQTIATGYTIHVCVSAQNKVIRPPPALQRLVGS